MSLTGRIYRGQIDFDFPRANRRVLIASAVLIIVSIGALFVQGLNLSVDFVGGTVWEVPSDTLTQDEALAELAKFDADSGSKVQVATDANDVRIVRVQSDVTDQQESTDITKGLAEAGGLRTRGRWCSSSTTWRTTTWSRCSAPPRSPCSGAAGPG